MISGKQLVLVTVFLFQSTENGIIVRFYLFIFVTFFWLKHCLTCSLKEASTVTHNLYHIYTYIHNLYHINTYIYNLWIPDDVGSHVSSTLLWSVVIGYRWIPQLISHSSHLLYQRCDVHTGSKHCVSHPLFSKIFFCKYEQSVGSPLTSRYWIGDKPWLHYFIQYWVSNRLLVDHSPPPISSHSLLSCPPPILFAPPILSSSSPFLSFPLILSSPLLSPCPLLSSSSPFLSSSRSLPPPPLLSFYPQGLRRTWMCRGS